MRPPRLSDVAEAAGVSKGTVSNVFNRPDVVRPEVRERVLAAAQSIGYQGPDPRGRLLSAGKVNAIGVATMEPLGYFFDDPFARVLMGGISAACDASGLGISLVSAASEEKLAWNMRSAVVDGFILFCLDDAAPLVALSRERRLPFVALASDAPDATVSTIGIDERAGGRAAARHLAELGHRRFAILALELAGDGRTGRVTPARLAQAVYMGTVERARGYFEALAAAGLDPAAAPMFETSADPASVEAALAEIFAAPAPPTAVLAQSDRIALIAMRWLQARGLSVPGDVSVVGFDGVPEGEAATPPLTTVAQPIAEIGRRAVRAIVDHPGEVTRERLATRLVARGSSGPAPI
jgi:DNA-binding LacI/PurR family transcriptional regulator